MSVILGYQLLPSNVSYVELTLNKKGEEIRDAELEKAMRKMGNLTEEQKEIMQFLANSIAYKLMNTPITQLKRYAQTEQGQKYTQFAQNLFDLPV